MGKQVEPDSREQRHHLAKEFSAGNREIYALRSLVFQFHFQSFLYTWSARHNADNAIEFSRELIQKTAGYPLLFRGSTTEIVISL